MDYGLGLPSTRPRASKELIMAAADAADQLGFSTVWATDHLLVNSSLAAEFGRVYEAITTLAFVGSRHPRLRLGTSVIVVPLRGGVELAKQVATLDDLSGGRVILGVGVGRRESEFANVGVGHRFKVRGAYLDETIALWRHLWSGSREPFRGRFYDISDFAFEPLPHQGARLPIWIGGSSPAALRRAGTIGDGYQSVPTSPDGYGRFAAQIATAAASSGRSMPTLSVRTRVLVGEPQPARGLPPQQLASGSQWVPQHFALRGTPVEVARQIAAYEALGVTHLTVDLPGSDPASFRRAAEQFMSEVAPLVEAVRSPAGG